MRTVRNFRKQSSRVGGRDLTATERFKFPIFLRDLRFRSVLSTFHVKSKNKIIDCVRVRGKPFLGTSRYSSRQCCCPPTRGRLFVAPLPKVFLFYGTTSPLVARIYVRAVFFFPPANRAQTPKRRRNSYR